MLPLAQQLTRISIDLPRLVVCLVSSTRWLPNSIATRFNYQYFLTHYTDTCFNVVTNLFQSFLCYDRQQQRWLVCSVYLKRAKHFCQAAILDTTKFHPNWISRLFDTTNQLPRTVYRLLTAVYSVTHQPVTPDFGRDNSYHRFSLYALPDCQVNPGSFNHLVSCLPCPIYHLYGRYKCQHSNFCSYCHQPHDQLPIVDQHSSHHYYNCATFANATLHSQFQHPYERPLVDCVQTAYSWFAERLQTFYLAAQQLADSPAHFRFYQRYSSHLRNFVHDLCPEWQIKQVRRKSWVNLPPPCPRSPYDLANTTRWLVVRLQFHLQYNWCCLQPHLRGYSLNYHDLSDSQISQIRIAMLPHICNVYDALRNFKARTDHCFNTLSIWRCQFERPHPVVSSNS